MSNEAFLRAILESPDDDTLRLVYADWLEEHGDPRGEFIRVQCQLATMAAVDERRSLLEERERRLLEEHQDEWLGSIRPWLSRWTFRRGFLDAISVPAAVYLRNPAFSRPATVRRVEVDLNGYEVPTDILEYIPESVAFGNDLLPLGFHGGMLLLAVQDPLDADTMEKLRFILNREVEAVLAPDGQVAEAIRRCYGDAAFAGEEPNLFGCFTSPPALPPGEVDLSSWDRRTRVARLLNRLLAEAVRRKAGEVRMEPGPDHIRVRYLWKGGSAEGAVTPIRLLWPLVRRLRIAAGIWMDDPRDVQEGVIRPTVRGERTEVGIVIRRTVDGPAVVLTFRPPDQAPAQESR